MNNPSWEKDLLRAFPEHSKIDTGTMCSNIELAPGVPFLLVLVLFVFFVTLDASLGSYYDYD